MKSQEITLIKYQADEGKVFAKKSNGEIVGRIICLGVNDSIDNYEEVDEPLQSTDNDTEEEAVE